MKEIGGYLELDQYWLPMLHEDAIALNCGRNCLAYLVESRKIGKIALPYFLCDTVKKVCQKYGIAIHYYHIGEDFLPQIEKLASDEWVYIVNYYGRLSNSQIQDMVYRYHRVIVDNAQAYFEKPLIGIDTIYTCRKYFGVSDGAFLYTESSIEKTLMRDVSFERIHFVLGRYEREASEFYEEASHNNTLFEDAPILRMSKLTSNLLHAIDYESVKNRRESNYSILAERLDKKNKLASHNTEGPFAYPLWLDNGNMIRKRLRDQKIYIPCLWPNVLQEMPENTLEYELANNILPLPCDQRYGMEDMLRIVGELENV